jgi:hypothetical protein
MPRKAKRTMTYFDYLESNKGAERYEFDTPTLAYEFGTTLRRNIQKEGSTEYIEVDISGCVVRVKLLDLQPA